ncbi:paired immunoglobulin-like type 2 receptor [Anaeramoeba flamelloides]|uniref:Paired immunoglobulin-like type 2 receptor n=1 Tax=Anaeramoeba flamelloides TaxID=1746091 RepID=A0AAV7Z9A2_9EUKA|nr:paired immunoglobulin-like type 2 receptor [Anaeramoeba flamelloides]
MKQKPLLTIISTLMILFLLQQEVAIAHNEKCLSTYHTPFQSIIAGDRITGFSSSTILTNGNTINVYTERYSTKSNSVILTLAILSKDDFGIILKKEITSDAFIISDPEVVSLDNSRFVVIYQKQSSHDSKTDYSIESQFFNGDGELEGPELTVLTQGSVIKGITGSRLNYNTIAISWVQLESNQFYTTVYTQLIDSTTYKTVTDKISVSPIVNNCKDPKIISLDEQNFAIFYTSEIIEEYGTFYSINYQKLNLNGDKIENRCISNYTDSYQDQPSILRLANGNYLVMWLKTPLDENNSQDVYRGVYAQVLDPSLNLEGKLITISNLVSNRFDQIPTMVQSNSDPDQLVLVAWVSKWATNFGKDLFQICGRFLTQEGQTLGSNHFEINDLSNYTLNSLFVTPDHQVVFSQKIYANYMKGNSFQLTKLHPPMPILTKKIPNQKFYVNSYFEFAFTGDTFLSQNNFTLNYYPVLSNGESLPSWIKFDSQKRMFYGNSSKNPIDLIIQVNAENVCNLKANTTFNFSIMKHTTPTPTPTPTHAPTQTPDPTATPTKSGSSNPSPKDSNKSSLSVGEIVSISSGISILLLIIFVMVVIKYRNQQKNYEFQSLLIPSYKTQYTKTQGIKDVSDSESNQESLNESSNSLDNSKDSLDDLISTDADEI